MTTREQKVQWMIRLYKRSLLAIERNFKREYDDDALTAKTVIG